MIPYIPNVTPSSAFPLSGLSDACLAFAAVTGRLAWCEFDSGFINSGNIRDRGAAVSYAITGTLAAETRVSGAGVAREGAVFNGSQTVNLGAIMPTAADYSVFAAYKQTAGGSNQGLLGSSGASYHAFFLSSAAGRLNISHAGAAQYTGAVDHALGTTYRAGMTWVGSSKAYAAYFNGVSEATGTGAQSNADATAIIGGIPGLAGDRYFRGTLFHLSLFNKVLSGADLTAVHAYLAEQFG